MSGKPTSVVDFETKAIGKRPNYPPKPVGVAIRWPDRVKEYLAWGHPSGNNCTVDEAYRKLKAAYQAERVIFHNAGFDMDVAECHLGLKPPDRFDDTMFLAFLNDPFERDLGLKPLSDKHLDLPPDEQDALRDWIQAHVPGAKKAKTKWAEFISEAPGDVVAPYAIGDVTRPAKLFRKFMPIVEARGMAPAYERELRVLPITIEMERCGVRVHRKRLKECLRNFERMDADIVKRIARKLRINPKDLKTEENKKGFNLNSGVQLGDALIRARKLSHIVKTPTGKVSTKIDNLKESINDKELLQLLSVHSVADKYITSFMHPWLKQSAMTCGRILPKFNQTRGRDYEGGGGARSGRFSSSDPNLQNVSNNPEESQNREILMLMQTWLQNDYHYKFRGMRDYILCDNGKVMICVDYNQQEIRLLAHFERGILMEAYLDDPNIDIHTFCQKLVKDAIGIEFPRKHIKITVFGIVYGMGIDKLAKRLGVDKETAFKVRQGIFQAIPGIPRLMKKLKTLANRDQPLTTWGGREYFCEEPRFDRKSKRWINYEYKMLNYLIQPSAADVTKQGMIQVYDRLPEVRIAIQVHDELVCMAPDKSYGPKIAHAMCDMKFRIPMLAEPKYSTTSWARAK